MNDRVLKASVAVSQVPARLRERFQDAREEIRDRGDRGDNPVVTAIIWGAVILIAMTIVGSLIALGNKADTKVDNVDIGD